MTITDSLEQMSNVHNGVIRFYEEGGVRYVRVAVETGEDAVVVIAKRKVDRPIEEVVAEAIAAATEESHVQVRRSMLKAV